MKITHIISKTPTRYILDLIEMQKTSNEVEVINIDAADPDYDDVIDKVVNSDRVISWSNVCGSGVRRND